MATLTDSFTPDNLISGDFPLKTMECRVPPSTSALLRNTAMCLVTPNIPTTGTAKVGNTGNGTMILVTGTPFTQSGIYTITCTVATTNGGTFKVVSPNGTILGYATVGTRFTCSELDFNLNDGATDFIVGDQFTVTVVVGNNAVSAYVSGGTNDTFYGILAEDFAGSVGLTQDTKCVLYITGEFNMNAIKFLVNTDNCQKILVDARKLGILFTPSVQA
jgi:hypothetical protein